MAAPVVVGTIGGPFGIRGWVHVQSFTEPPANLLAYRPWLLRQDGDWLDADAEARPHGHAFVARFRGCDDRDQAATLRGSEIGICADALPPPEPDEYYWRDLIGCAVVAEGEEAPFGEVRRVFDTPAHDVLVIGHAGGEHMIPFVGEIVRDVDAAAKRIVVDAAHAPSPGQSQGRNGP